MSAALDETAALFFLQGPVDRLQVIDSEGLLGAINSLTSFRKGVDSHSFFDITNVLPVGGESGTQVRSRQHGESWKRRKLETARAGSGKRVSEGLFSELLVEANMRCSEAKNRSPEALTDLPGWW